MNILHLCADPGIALDGSKGASVHLRSIAAAFARDHRVVAVTRRRSDDGTNFPFEVVHPDRHDTADGSFDRAIDRAIERFGVPDVVYERYSLGHDAGLRLARRLGRPFVLEVNAPLVSEARTHRPASVTEEAAGVETTLFREADLIVAVSTPLRDHIAEVRGDGPVTVQHNGFDPALFDGDVAPDPQPTIGFLGHPKPWHGAQTLPDVLAELRRRGHDARLLVVGGGPGVDAILESARACSVADHVEVTGPLAQASAVSHIRRAWVGMAPYPSDDFFYFSPIKVVEYLAAGIPVVSTALGDVPDLVGDGGIVVRPDDLRACVDAVDRLLQNGAERAEFGARGRARMSRTQTWQAVADRTIEAIGRLPNG